LSSTQALVLVCPDTDSRPNFALPEAGAPDSGAPESGAPESVARLATVPEQTAEPAAPEGSAVVPVRRSSHPKKSVEFAWAAWQATSTAASASEFLQSVSSWTEGTAAQLLRRRWTAGFKPPTSAQVQERLRHNLGLVARGRQSTHIEALGRARDSVIEELRRAQLPPRAASSKSKVPTGKAGA